MTSSPFNSDYIRSAIVQQLAAGEFCSGENLGEQFGISRAAISNHIKCLVELGLDIFSVHGKGYKLASAIELLAKDTILQHLEKPDSAQLTVLNVIDSTNQFIKEHHDDMQNGHVCLAEAQTAGRGRHGRRWVSPYGASLYLSMHWSFSSGYQALGGLSLAVGVAIVKALQNIGIHHAQLKWPNDIYLEGKKLAGVLIEVEGQIGAACQCIVGIGLNVNLPKNVTDIEQPYIDIASLLPEMKDRNYLAALIIDSLSSTMTQFEQQGFGPFVDDWRKADVFANKPIKLLLGKNTIEGFGRGIDDNGALLLETAEGLRAFQGGEISVRAN